MKKFFAFFPRGIQFLKEKIAAGWRAVRPEPGALKGAALAVLAVAGLVYLAFVISVSQGPLLPGLLVGLGLVGMGLLLLFLGQGIAWVIGLLARIPWGYRWVLLGGMALLVFPMMSLSGGGLPLVMALLLGCASLLGAGIAALRGWRAQALPRRVFAGLLVLLGAAGLAGGLAWHSAWRGYAEKPVIDAAATGAPLERVSLPDPAQPGAYAVKTLTYGSGTDRYRPEYAAGAALITTPVDGSKLLNTSWKEDIFGQLRTAYWGFGPDNLPLNGRAWYSEGPGPFPLIVAVHGNHLNSDFSDPGYAYLGELLASRGFIFVSVDMNFINSGVTDFVRGFQEENDARGWLLLRHLEQWLAWNNSPSTPFYGRVDADALAVMGHSRGGEAAAIAAAFNRLPYYPDNAGLPFNFNYNIRAVMAIAPVDGQYEPTWRSLPLANVNYLVLHGSHDADVKSFSGLRLYERLRFDDGQDWFKAAVYIYRANHGQFNTTWGDNDQGGLMGGFLNRAALLAGDEQRQAAAVYISAFFEAALKGQTGYLPLFQDSRAAGEGWLPETVYISRFDRSGDVLVAGIDEDIDLNTATLPGARTRGQNLETWREQRVNTKWGGGETSGVYLGWNENDTATYTIELPGDGTAVTARAILFNLADAGEDPDPAEGAAEEAKPPEDAPRQPIDLTVQVEDAAGAVAALPLSQYRPVQASLPAGLYKAGAFSQGAASESILQSYALPLADFARANPQFDPARLRAIRFVFDRTPRGSVVLDAVGLR
jgi:hypothetical protein